MASDLPVDLLEEIFHRLDDAADLIRASAACTWFRRVVSDDRFLRRFRTLHCRPVLGLLLSDRFYAAQPPRRSAQAAAGFAKAADFNFAYFLPDRERWCVCDVHDGRLLLTQFPCYDMSNDLVVYDPLHRRHIQIPTIPGDLLLQDGNNEAMRFDSRPFLTPAVDDDDDDESLLRFQVTCIIALSKTEVVAVVFSSASGQWRRGASFHNSSYDWAELFLLSFRRQHVHGRVCWSRLFTNVMLVYDTREMKFSVTDLPHDSIGMFKTAVEAGDGRLGLLLHYHGCTVMDLYSKAWQGIQEPEEWRHDSSIPIMPGFRLTMMFDGGEGYALLLGTPQDQYKRWVHTHTHKKPEAHYFTLDLKTFLVEKLCVMEDDGSRNNRFLYASFPPLFSSPSV